MIVPAVSAMTELALPVTSVAPPILPPLLTVSSRTSRCISRSGDADGLELDEWVLSEGVLAGDHVSRTESGLEGERERREGVGECGKCMGDREGVLGAKSSGEGVKRIGEMGRGGGGAR